jgi:hypothetical protein
MATRALLVGINRYSNGRFDLRGCVNDAESLARLLCEVYGFGAGDCELVLDAAATRATILSRLDALLSSAAAGDTVVFGFSGHGTQVKAADPGETDLKDECIVPYETSYTSLIRDNELRDLFGKYVDEHVKFTAIYDCCHSGTMMRTLSVLDDGSVVEDVVNRYLDLEDLTDRKTRSSAIGPYNVLGACLDDQTAADVREAGPEKMPRGAFSHALHGFLRSGGGARDVPVALAEPQIAARIGAISGHRQEPSYQLIDMNSPLIRY